MKISDIHRLFLKSEGVSTDTRQNLKNKLFFALKGANFNGNEFAQKALEKGAAYAVVEEEGLPDTSRFIKVDQVLKTLQKLAAYHREYLGLPIIAITGSNGKTTTKELMAAVLAQTHQVTFTQGNLNNHIGVPLTLLNMNERTTLGIVEMGANHQREIASLCEIARPDYGYITNFGKAHLEGFGGFEGVIKGKSELYDFLKANGKKIFVNADDPLEVKQSKGGQTISFSKHDNVDCQVVLKNADPYVSVCYDDTVIYSHLLGDYNAKNIAAAINVGKYFKVKTAAIKRAIENYIPDNNRSQIIEKGTNQIILDAYNANPTSMALAIENFEKFPAQKRVAVLGDMFEVGETALKEHQAIVNYLEASDLDEALVCGECFGKTQVQRVEQFTDFKALQTAVAQKNFQSSAILVKGSRGMAMERLLAVL